MSIQTDNLSNLVKPYGLSEAESNVYLFLLQHGFATALELSRKLHIGRTKVYRLLDLLKGKQLVEYQLQERGMLFGATHPSKFEQLITQREQAVSALKQSLPQLIEQLTAVSAQQANNAKVLYYEGSEGMKQISYNITRTKGILRVFEMEHLSEFVPFAFAETVRRELVDNKVSTRDLTNKTSSPGYTDVVELIRNFTESRYISPEKLTINFEVLIYNDVYATYSYKHDQIFGVEIYNEQLAEMQKQLFDFVWDQAQPMQFVDSRGATAIQTNSGVLHGVLQEHASNELETMRDEWDEK